MAARPSRPSPRSPNGPAPQPIEVLDINSPRSSSDPLEIGTYPAAEPVSYRRVWGTHFARPATVATRSTTCEVFWSRGADR